MLFRIVNDLIDMRSAFIGFGEREDLSFSVSFQVLTTLNSEHPDDGIDRR